MVSVLDIRRLEVLKSVVDTGSITEAAHTLGFTVSSVSQQMTTLESQLDVVLFEKSGRGIRPTAAAVLLAGHAKIRLAAVADAEHALEDLRLGPWGHVRVAQVEVFDPDGTRVLLAKGINGRIDLAKLNSIRALQGFTFECQFFAKLTGDGIHASPIS